MEKSNVRHRGSVGGAAVAKTVVKKPTIRQKAAGCNGLLCFFAALSVC
jgi:hypothetical protein